MAIVTGLTAEAMQAIRDGVIVGAHIDGDNLILEKYDSTEIDAGNVRGPTGATGDTGDTGPSGNTVVTSGTRPGSPTDGQQIYETDTQKTLHWDASRSLWLPDWSVPWGYVAGDKKITNSSNYTASGNTDFLLENVQVYDGRLYRINVTCGTLVSGRWAFEVSIDGVNYARLCIIEPSPSLNGDVYSGDAPYQPNATAQIDLRIKATELSAGGLTLAATATTPRFFWIEDIGPENGWSL